MFIYLKKYKISPQIFQIKNPTKNSFYYSSNINEILDITHHLLLIRVNILKAERFYRHFKRPPIIIFKTNKFRNFQTKLKNNLKLLEIRLFIFSLKHNIFKIINCTNSFNCFNGIRCYIF